MKRILLAAALVATLLGTSCGGDAPAAQAEGTTTTTTEKVTTTTAAPLFRKTSVIEAAKEAMSLPASDTSVTCGPLLQKEGDYTLCDYSGGRFQLTVVKTADGSGQGGLGVRAVPIVPPTTTTTTTALRGPSAMSLVVAQTYELWPTMSADAKQKFCEFIAKPENRVQVDPGVLPWVDSVCDGVS